MRGIGFARRIGAPGTVLALLALCAPARADGEWTLRYRLRPGDRFAYVRTATVAGTFRLRPRGAAAGGDSSETTLQVVASVRAASTQDVAGRLPDGSYRVLERHVLRVEVGGQPLPIPAFGPMEVRLSPLGVKQKIGSSAFSDLLPFGLGLPDLLPGAVLQFPPDPVRVGARWQTRAEWTLPGQQQASTTASSCLAAVEEAGGQRCARIATEAAIPAFVLAAGTEEGAGMLRVRGVAAGETLHALDTGMPLLSRMRIRLWIEAQGASVAGEATPAGVGELAIDIDSRQVTAETRPLPVTAPALPASRPAPSPKTPVKAKPRAPRRPARPQAAARGARPGEQAAVRGLIIRQPAAYQSTAGELIVDCEVGLSEARYAILCIDGVTRAAINAPYRYRLDLDGIGPGEHVLGVTVYASEGVALATARRRFRVR